MIIRVSSLQKIIPKSSLRSLSFSIASSTMISHESASHHHAKDQKVKLIDYTKLSISTQSVNSFEICVVFEDDHIIAINKPANMLSVPASSTTISEFNGVVDVVPDQMSISTVNSNDSYVVGNSRGSKRKRRFEEWSETIKNASNYTLNESVRGYLRGFTNIDNIPRQEKAFKRYVERNFRELRADKGSRAEKIKDDMWDAVSKCDIDLHRGSLDDVPMQLWSAFEIIRSRTDVMGPSTLWKVHRLDYDTSGLLLFAKTSEAASEMCRQFRDKEVRKLYLAEVMNTPERHVMCINKPLAPHPDIDMKPRQIVSGDGKEAITYMRSILLKSKSSNEKEDKSIGEEVYSFAFDEDSVLDSNKRFVDSIIEDDDVVVPTNSSMVMLEPITGRSHQLRVHMQYIGCPILGDSLYATPQGEKSRSRLCLHAHKIRFKHPVNGKDMELTANLIPAPSSALDYKAWIESLA